MKIHLIAPDSKMVKQEVTLIMSMCEFENIHVTKIDQTQKELFNYYYKGGRPVIVIDYDCYNEPKVVYGYWAFTSYILLNGLIQC